MKSRTKFPQMYLAVVLLLLYIPILLTVLYSFNESKISSVWGGWSLKWYVELFHDRDLQEALLNSLVLAGLSCLSASVIGTLGALGMSKTKCRGNGVIEYSSMIPIMIPEIILGMVFLAFFSLLAFPFGMVTLVLAHTAFCIPYVFTMVKARLADMDPSLEAAARDLGAAPIRVFFDITLPLISPAILSGMLLAFAMSFDDVVISIFVTGPKINTLPIKIYTKMKTGVTPEINALATLLLAATICLVLLSGIIGKKQKRG